MKIHALTTLVLVGGLLMAADGPMVMRPGKLPTAALPKWFMELDTDHDGQIALSEWHDAKKDVDEFREWDRDDDGFITAEEAIYKMLLLQLANGNGNGKTDDVTDFKNLRPGHPRLLILDDDIVALKTQIERSPRLRAWYDQLQADAGEMLAESPIQRELVGPRMLDQSRKAFRRITTLAGLYRLDGDHAKAERAIQEMLAAAAFPDWNPSHFLDTAEMTAALAIGYDWLFDVLSRTEKRTIREAIVARGLRPGLQAYHKSKGWHNVTHNWNQVCNGGLTLGALAVAETDQALALEIVKQGRASIAHALKSFAPDGGWAEGPGYWNYATQYTVLYLAALQTALHTDFKFKKMPGLATTGNFRMHTIGPSQRSFNFADGGDKVGAAPHMLWLAREFGCVEFAAHEHWLAGAHPSIFHLLWSSHPFETTIISDLPRDAVFKNAQVACLRGTWDDPHAFFVGFRGGDNAANHSHLDLGSFVLDALGERWALDLGGDHYNLPGYFGKERANYYRVRTEGHNTLTLDNQNQPLAAKAPLVAFYSSPQKSFAVADLTEGYAPDLKQVYRGIALLRRNQVLVQDEWYAPEPQIVVWNFHTKAALEVQGDRAILAHGSAQLEARILSPKGARFAIASADAPFPQTQQPDVRNLTITLTDKGPTRLAVLFTLPQNKRTPALEPLERWIAAGEMR